MTLKITFKNGHSQENPYLSDIHIMQNPVNKEIIIDIESLKLNFAEHFSELDNIEKIEITP